MMRMINSRIERIYLFQMNKDLLQCNSAKIRIAFPKLVVDLN